MGKFLHAFTVAASLQKVAAFHSHTEALKKLNFPLIGLQFHRIEALAENSVSDFTLWIGPIPVHWVARHIEVTKESGFVDIQEQGPFKYWRHRHAFQPIDNSHTEIVDEIQYEYAQSIFNHLLGHLMVLNLPIMFAYRARATRKTLEN